MNDQKSILNIENKAKLTPEEIIGKLFYFHSQAHFLHLQTKSFAQHKALDELYKELVELKDEISEQLLGYTNSRFKNLPGYPFKPYTENAPIELCNEIIEFAQQFIDYAVINKYQDLGNLGQDLSGLAAGIKYLLSLK